MPSPTPQGIPQLEPVVTQPTAAAMDIDLLNPDPKDARPGRTAVGSFGLYRMRCASSLKVPGMTSTKLESKQRAHTRKSQARNSTEPHRTRTVVV